MKMNMFQNKFLSIKFSVKADLSLILKNAEAIVLNTFNFEILRENTNKYLNFSGRELFEKFSSIKTFWWNLTIFWKCEIPLLHSWKYATCHELYVMNLKAVYLGDPAQFYPNSASLLLTIAHPL